MKTFITLALTLFLVMDPLGNLPNFLSLVSKFPAKKRRLYVLRELLFALIIMVLFHYLGQGLIPLLGVSTQTVKIAGGIILFLIAIRLIFGNADETSIPWQNTEPYIVPIATPLIASPSVLAVVMMLSEFLPSLQILGTITLAWFCAALIFLAGPYIYKVMKPKGLIAAQRLVGLIVTIISVQFFLRGIKALLE